MEFLEIIPSYQARFLGEMAFRDPSVPSEFRELISNKKSLPFYLARKGQRLLDRVQQRAPGALLVHLSEGRADAL